MKSSYLIAEGTPHRYITLVVVLIGLSSLLSLFFSSTSFAAPMTVSTGIDHTCAIVQHTVKCWGSNEDGKLGINAPLTGSITSPQAVHTKAPWSEEVTVCDNFFIVCTKSHKETKKNPGSALHGKNVTKVSAGVNHTCAVADALVYCWGDNRYGQLGNKKGGWLVKSYEPVEVARDKDSALYAKEIIDVSAGYEFTCALASDGSVACWGRDDHGQVGGNGPGRNTRNQSAEFVNYPRPVKGGALQTTKVKKLAELNGYTTTMCVITANDDGVCWGRNDLGQAGSMSANTTGYAMTTGYGYDTRANRCSTTDREAEEDAKNNYVGTIGEIRTSIVANPHKVAGNLKFSTLSITTQGNMFQDQEFMEKGETIAFSYTTGITADASKKPYYWGGSGEYYYRNECLVNGDYRDSQKKGSGAEWSKTFIELNVFMFVRDYPSGPIYDTSTAKVLQNQPLSKHAGMAFLGSNWATRKQCLSYNTTKTVLWTTKTETHNVCEEPAPGISCATTIGAQAAIQCETYDEACTAYSSSLARATLKLSGKWDQACTPSGPSAVPAGTNNWPQNKPITDLDTGFSSYTCAVSADNIVNCWGKNDKGQLGTGDRKTKATPVKVNV